MRQAVIEVPKEINLLSRPDRATFGLKNLIGSLEKKRYISFSFSSLLFLNLEFEQYINLILMLHITLTGTKFMKRIAWFENHTTELIVEASDWKARFEILKIEKEILY